MIVAFVPARSGSERVKDKNILEINGVPIIHYTLISARDSGVFDRIVVSTDSDLYGEIASQIKGVEVLKRPGKYSKSTSPDIEWVKHAICELDLKDDDIFSILRPTSPLRRVETIRKAIKCFGDVHTKYDSLRAIAKVDVHPGKMWIKNHNTITPLLPFSYCEIPWHSSQKKVLPEVYYQTASLEVASVSTVLKGGSISGEHVYGFEVDGVDKFDINEIEDIDRLKKILTHNQ